MVVPFMAIYFREKLNISPSEVGILIGISPFSSMLFSVLGGRLGDKYGPATIFPFSLFVPALCFLGYTVSPYYLICIFAAVSGVGWSLFNSTIKSLLTEYTSENVISKVFSYNYWGVNLGGVIGPLVGVYFMGAGHSNFPIFIFSGVLILLSIFLFILLRKVKNPPHSFSNQINSPLFNKDMFFTLFKDRLLIWLTICYFLLYLTESQINANISQYLSLSYPDGAVIFAHLISLSTIIIVIVQPIYAHFSDK